ncbi:MAG: hypothetical protein RR215_05080 [Ruthenibacterium sp.]
MQGFFQKADWCEPQASKPTSKAGSANIASLVGRCSRFAHRRALGFLKKALQKLFNAFSPARF